MSRYRFIEAEKQMHPVNLLCRVLEVSRAAYYRWKARPASPRSAANLVLLEKVRKVHDDSDGTYGSPRIHAELQDQGVRASRGRIARLMASFCIVGRRGRRRVRTTIPAKKPAPFADLVKRRFSAEHPDRIWCGDITYVHTGEGFLYLATVIDVFSRRVIGWSIATHMRAELVCDALRMAIANRHGQVRGVIFHSDRGVQYGAGNFMEMTGRAGVRQSMGRVADCFDNSLAESFFATLKGELLYTGRGRPDRRREVHSSTGSRPSITVDVGTAPSACSLPWSMKSGIRYSAMQPNNAVRQIGASPLGLAWLSVTDRSLDAGSLCAYGILYSMPTEIWPLLEHPVARR